MTLAAPKSRQGKFVLVLAFLAAVIAVAAVFTWSTTARADITTVTASANDNAGATINQGDPILYTVTVTVTGAVGGTTTNTQLIINFDDELQGFSTPNGSSGTWGSPQATECTNGAGNVVTCTDALGPIATSTVLIGFLADGTLISPPASCVVTDNGAGSATCDVSAIANVTVNSAVTVPNATNFPGQPHTFQFTLGHGVTCESDTGNPINNNVDCAAGDVVVAGAAGCLLTAGPTVTDADLVDTSFVSVTIDGGTGVSGTCTVTLDTKHVGNSDDPAITFNNFDIAPVVATKTLTSPAGEIRHLDEADAATEDAAGTADSDKLEDWCATAPGTCGILVPQDDSDDATGSFHQACIINTSLTHAADAANITWNIVAVAGSPLPTPVSITEVPGPQTAAEPCVRWSTGFTGVQNITAVYDNGVGNPVTFYWDGYCEETQPCQVVEDADTPGTDVVVPLPLVKEWNTIDETKIVAAAGVVGDTLATNTSGLANWASRDCSTDPVDAGFCTNPDLDGLTLGVEATIFIQTPQLFINAPAKSFIDYTLGAHNTNPGGSYAGPVDGAEQTYTISGDCGSVRLEDPQSATTIVLSNGVANPASATVLSSDKGVGFTFVPNSNGAVATTFANADCGPNATICIDITTEEDNLFRSPPIDDAADERVCVTYTIGPPTSKTPQLAWAGQRTIVEHFWGSVDASGDLVCSYAQGDPQEPEPFYVLYSVQAGPGSFTAALQNNFTDVSQSGRDAIVQVYPEPMDVNNDGVTDANSGCISRVIFENQDQAQNDIIAYVVEGPLVNGLAGSAATNGLLAPDLSNATPVSQQVAFVIYYMKFEDATLTLVPGTRASHNSGAFSPNSPLDSSTDVTEMTDVNVSADVLARLRVRGWVETTNCPARDSGVGANGEFLPANRCIFPDDWRFKAGGGVGDSLNNPATVAGFAEESRPNFDIAGVVPAAPANQSVCNAAPRASGPFSWLDTNVNGVITAAPCGDSLAPNVVAGNACLVGSGSCREVIFPNGVINAFDAYMPPALARFALSGSGFLRPADKDSIYSSGNLFYTAHIPAEPWIAPINNDLQGYQWNSWGAPGARAGQYQFWTSLADNSAEILSCAGPSTGAHVFLPGGTDPCLTSLGSGVPTGGYDMTKVYTDNHGEAMTWINGDANLAFTDCVSSAGSANSPVDHDIVLLSGYYCEKDDLVGSSTLGASVDYPDKRKHFAIESNDVTITWVWGGIKEVTIEAGESAQFNYVVFHVTDRDGFCNSTTSLHPVLGERVVFTIDSSDGIIFPNVNGDPAALLGTWTTKTADVTTFATAANTTIALGGLTAPTIVTGECQAWIHITESLLSPVNVIVTAYDPEGTVTFDKIVNAPTPTPPPATPSPTPANQQNLWADLDCDSDVNPVDSLKMLRADAGLSVPQNASCPAPGTSLDVIWDTQSTNEKWGDADCSGSLDPVDSLKVLRFDAGLFYIQQEPCPDIGAEVLIPQQ